MCLGPSPFKFVSFVTKNSQVAIEHTLCIPIQVNLLGFRTIGLLFINVEVCGTGHIANYNTSVCFCSSRTVYVPTHFAVPGRNSLQWSYLPWVCSRQCTKERGGDLSQHGDSEWPITNVYPHHSLCPQYITRSCQVLSYLLVLFIVHIIALQRNKPRMCVLLFAYSVFVTLFECIISAFSRFAVLCTVFNYQLCNAFPWNVDSMMMYFKLCIINQRSKTPR